MPTYLEINSTPSRFYTCWSEIFQHLFDGYLELPKIIIISHQKRIIVITIFELHCIRPCKTHFAKKSLMLSLVVIDKYLYELLVTIA